MKVRKRVTLMVVTVTAMFGVCWLSDSIVYVLWHHKYYIVDAITHTMILFNSAVNPFVYALLNRNFREKIKGVICCTGSTTAARVPARLKPAQGIAFTNITTRPTHITAPGSIESSDVLMHFIQNNFSFNLISAHSHILSGKQVPVEIPLPRRD